MRNFTQFLTVALLTAFFAGCAQVDVAVNAYRARNREFPPPAADNTLAIVTGTDLGETLLQDEVAAKLAYLLEQRGYAVVPRSQARYLLSCWFSMDSGRQFSGVSPTYVPGGYGTYGYGTGFYPRYYSGFGMGATYYAPYTYVAFCKYVGLTLYDNQQLGNIENPSPENTPPPRIEPNEPTPGGPKASSAPYERAPMLRRQDPAVARLQGLRNQAILWQCTAANCNSSTDLRQMVDYLLLGGFRYFGEDTGKQRYVTINPNSAEAKSLAAVTR